MNITNRWFLLLGGLLSAVLVFTAACGGDDDDGDGGNGTPAATAGSGDNGDRAPADQQKIVVAQPEPQFYDPHRSNFERDIGIERMLWRGLYQLVDDGDGGVAVATAMADGDPTVEGSVYTVKLKSGLKWSDGEPLTAQHFVDGALRACDKTVASPYQYLLGAGYLELVGCDAYYARADDTNADALRAAVGVAAVDDTTVSYTLAKPNDRFTTIMALWVTFPARMDVISEHGAAWTDPANIVTNGPFTISALTPRDSVTLVPNPNWSGTAPGLQELKIQFLETGFRQFADESIDMTRIGAQDIAAAESGGLGDEVLILPTARITSVEMQMKNPTLADFNVRLALSRSIDREQLNEVVYDGTNTPATYWVVKGLTGHQGNEAFDDIIGFDADAAKQALADAGYAEGANFPELGIIIRDTPENRNLGDYLVKAWQDTLGITVVPEYLTGSAGPARFNAQQFDMFIGGWNLDYPDIENPLRGLFDTGGGQNKYNCSDPEVDAAFADAAAATTDEARIDAYMRVETEIVTGLCGVAPLFQDSLPFLVSAKIGGVTANGTIDAGLPGNWCGECWYVKAD